MQGKKKTPFAFKLLVATSILLLVGLFALPFIAGDNTLRYTGILLLIYFLSVLYAMKDTLFKRFTPKDFSTYLTDKAEGELEKKNYKSFLLLASVTPMVVIGLATIVLILFVIIVLS